MSAMAGVHLMRFGWKSLPLISTRYPCIALVLQGTKSVEFGGRHLEYGAGQYLLASVDIPAASRIVNASSTHPLLAVAVDINFAELRDVIRRCDVLPQSSPESAISVFDADVDLLEAVVRFLRLLDRQEDAKPLAPLVLQEIFYRLLSGASGSRLLEICRGGSPSGGIADGSPGCANILRRASWLRTWLDTLG
jgi:hypothetical protein